MTGVANVMISYRTADRAVADELHRELEAAGLAPWMDYKRIQPGSKWRDELLREVTRCDAFVALLTPAYVESEHCRMEVFLARSRGVPILPVMLEDCFEHLDRYEETKGLADLFLLRLYRLSVVGLAITREDALRRLVDAARSLGQAPPQKAVYVAYCNDEAELATRIASELERAGVPAWVATRDCRVGDNWRQAQARGVMHASVQLVVMDRTIARSHVLRTEIMLGEAFGLPVLTVLGRDLANDPAGVADVMASLRAADLTFRRLTDLQPFGCDEASVAALVAHLRSTAGVPAPAPEPAPR